MSPAGRMQLNGPVQLYQAKDSSPDSGVKRSLAAARETEEDSPPEDTGPVSWSVSSGLAKAKDDERKMNEILSRVVDRM